MKKNLSDKKKAVFLFAFGLIILIIFGIFFFTSSYDTSKVGKLNNNEAAVDTQPYDIGVFYFSSWNSELAPHMIANTELLYGRKSDWFGGIKDHLTGPGQWGYGPIPDREPLLGWYDDSQQKIIDQHILQASSRGIDHFAFYYYWKEDGSKERPGQNINNFVKSKYKDLMDFYVYFVADGTWDRVQWRTQVVPGILKYISDPSYKKTKDGRPIIGFFGDMVGRFGGVDQYLKSGLDYLREECRKKGYGNPLLLVDGYRTLSKFIKQGYDGFLPLNLAGIGIEKPGTPENYSSSYPDAWNAFVTADYSEDSSGYENYENYLYIPGGMNAFDARPWRKTGYGDKPVEEYVYTEPSPSKFRKQLENVKAYLETHPNCMNMATFYAWNELGEGGVLEPTTLYNYGYLDEMQNVFGLVNKEYKDIAAKDKLEDIAPDLRVQVEPEHSTVTENENVKIKVRIKSYHEATVDKISMTIDAGGWQMVSSKTVELSEVKTGKLEDAVFEIAAGSEGETWAKHPIKVKVDYTVDGSEMSQEISTFIVKVPKVYGIIEKINIPDNKEPKFQLKLKIRNYSMKPVSGNYRLSLPDGMIATNDGTGKFQLSGYQMNVEEGRVQEAIHVIDYPGILEPDQYGIGLELDYEGVKDKTNVKVMVEDPANLLVNGGMEFDQNSNGIADNWNTDINIQSDSVLSIDSAVFKQGKRSQKITGAGLNKGISQEWVEVDPEKKYTVEFWAKIDSGAIAAVDGEAAENWDWLGHNLEKIITSKDNKGEWKKYSFDFTPKIRAKRASIRFLVWSEEKTTVYVDNVVFKEKN